MLFQISVNFEGETFVKGPYKIKIDPYIVMVLADKQNLVKELCIQKKVVDYTEFLPKFLINSEKGHSLTAPSNPHYEDIINIIQHIESLGSFWFQIRKIHWDRPEVEWVPENDEERHEIKVNKINFSMSYDNSPREMHPKRLIQVIQKRDLYKHLLIPLSFYRE